MSSATFVMGMGPALSMTDMTRMCAMLIDRS
jgi:hypothetical protein